MKSKLLVLVLVLALGIGLASMGQTPAVPKHRALFPLNVPQGDDWGYMLAHVQNLRADFANDGGVEVEIVFYNNGIQMLNEKTSPFGPALQALASAGVHLMACRNSMRGRDLKSEDLFPFITEVNSGVGEIIRKQEAGWGYIR